MTADSRRGIVAPQNMGDAPSPPRVRWAFLDRDGTINVPPAPGDYVRSPADLRLLPGAAQAIRLLNESGVWVGVVTNQRGIALGRMTEHDLEAVHERLTELLAREGAYLDAIAHCPHDVGECACRKPAPGMLLQASRAHPGLDLARAAIVGDNESDVLAGASVGALAVRISADTPCDSVADHVTTTLLEAVGWLLEPDAS